MRLKTKSVTEADFYSIYAALMPLKPIGNYKGFRLLVSTVEEILKKDSNYYNLSRDIYPLVADAYCCKKSSIERNLRTLLLNMDMTDLQNFTNTDIPDKITVSQLIDVLVVYFLQQQLKFR